MDNNINISLIVALRSGVQLALKYIHRLLIVIGIVALSVVVASAVSVLLMLLVAQISTSPNVLVAAHAVLFVLANIFVHGFILWYFKEILRIVRGHTRSFPELKESLARGWQLLAAQVLFALAVGAVLLVFTYPISLLADYLSLSTSLVVLLTLVLYLPGLYVAARLCLYPYFLADGKGIVDSLRASFMITGEHVLKLIPMGIVRILALLSIIVTPFTLLTISALLKVGLMLMAGLFLGAIFDLAAAHIYQRLTHPDQAAVPPGVHPLD